MAPDDWMAILYLLQRPDVSIKAITVSGSGETHCEPGIQHARGLVALGGGGDIPVACGREKPLQGSHTFPKSWREAADSLLGLSLPQTATSASKQTAVELLTSAIQSSPEKVVLLTLGPLTNVAEALQTTPSLVNNLKMIYIMGGAVDVPGNIAISGVGIDNKVAEWNIYVDPHAANVVFKSGAPVTLVPLDATIHALLTASFYERIKDTHSSPEATFVFDLLTKNYGMIESGQYYFWDPLSAAISSDESLATYQTMNLAVVEEEGPESGRIIKSTSNGSVRVAVHADGPRFEQIFLQTLNGQLTSTATATSGLGTTTATTISTTQASSTPSAVPTTATRELLTTARSTEEAMTMQPPNNLILVGGIIAIVAAVGAVAALYRKKRSSAQDR
jgi:inosine-uridine nucleoside N-ribohydrolase